MVRPSQPTPSHRARGPPPSSESRFGGALLLLLLSLLFHVVYLSSIFDIYFKSPVTKGVENRFGVTVEGAGEGPHGLAKRVVLIVGDGLRADKLFQSYPNPPFPDSDPLPSPMPDVAHSPLDDGRTTPAPFLRELVQSGEAAWGVSHTRVPTESRPGHVALIAGMYEDVSAVTRGWQANPVSFDSVFNQSSHTYSFGSPDILPMFQHGATPGRVDGWSYSEEEEDFSKDAVHLDLWVLDKLHELFSNASTSPSLDAQLREDGTVLFLHLLGLDTTGHSYRPHGKEYHRNIRVVDWVVEETVNAVNSFYGDEETAFVFTADHGMSSKGNHGDGEPDNTRTPLVVWGKGVTRAPEEEGSTAHDEYSAPWGLHGVRRDVEQADVAVLMAVLAGVPIPANSAGRIPIAYLDASASFKARAALANANQILAEFEAKSENKRAHALNFKPYPALVDDGTHRSVEGHQRGIEALLAQGSYDEAQAHALELIGIGLEGLRYFQTYDWLILRTIVTLGYLGFVAYSLKFILHSYVLTQPELGLPPSLSIPAAGMAIFAGLSTRFCLEQAPLSYYAYAVFPCFFWSAVLSDTTPFQRVLRATSESGSLLSHALKGAATVGMLQYMVQGYFRRTIFTALVTGMGVWWPYVGTTRPFRRQNRKLLASWMVSCGVLSIFPCLPAEKGEDVTLIVSGAVAFLVLGVVALRWLPAAGSVTKDEDGHERPSATLAQTKQLIKLEMVLTLLAVLITCSSVSSLQAKRGLPLPNQLAGWAVLLSSLCIPLYQGRPRAQPFFERLLVILFGFCPAFVILSLSYEALFFAAFCTTLCLWMFVECEIAQFRGMETHGQGKASKVGVDHFRIGLFFLTFLHVAFFGVGNVASISSFYLEPVFRLIPVFAPFPMAILLLFKILCPFVALSAVSSVLGRRLRLPPFSLFIIASTLSEVLTLNHFFNVTDQGSWLEIGSTITNFAICSLLSIFNTVLYLGGESVLAYTQV